MSPRRKATTAFGGLFSGRGEGFTGGDLGGTLRSASWIDGPPKYPLKQAVSSFLLIYHLLYFRESVVILGHQGFNLSLSHVLV